MSTVSFCEIKYSRDNTSMKEDKLSYTKSYYHNT